MLAPAEASTSSCEAVLEFESDLSTPTLDKLFAFFSARFNTGTKGSDKSEVKVKKVLGIV